jgi:hypothetical protein
MKVDSTFIDFALGNAAARLAARGYSETTPGR